MPPGARHLASCRGFRGLLIGCAFLAVTAIGGGIALLSGAVQPGMNLLDGSPFTTYLVPGLVLLFAVGGSALAATFLLAFGHRVARPAVELAGLMIVAFELVEMFVIGSPQGAARNLQVFYLSLGATLVVLSSPCRRTRNRALVVSAVVVGLALVFAHAVRPRFLNWGASDDEQLTRGLAALHPRGAFRGARSGERG